MKFLFYIFGIMVNDQCNGNGGIEMFDMQIARPEQNFKFIWMDGRQADR